MDVHFSLVDILFFYTLWYYLPYLSALLCLLSPFKKVPLKVLIGLQFIIFGPLLLIGIHTISQSHHSADGFWYTYTTMDPIRFGWFAIVISWLARYTALFLQKRGVHQLLSAFLILLTVVGIIAGYILYQKHNEKLEAIDTKTEEDLLSLENATNTYADNQGKLPTNIEELLQPKLSLLAANHNYEYQMQSSSQY